MRNSRYCVALIGEHALYQKLPLEVIKDAESLALNVFADVPVRDLAALLAGCSDLRQLHLSAARLSQLAALLPHPLPNMTHLRVQTMGRISGTEIAALTRLAPNLRALETVSLHWHNFELAQLEPLMLDFLLLQHEPAALLIAIFEHEWTTRALALAVTRMTLRALTDFELGVGAFKTIRSLVLLNRCDSWTYGDYAEKAPSLLGSLIAACHLCQLKLQGTPKLIADTVSVVFGMSTNGIKRLELCFEDVELTEHVRPAVTALTAVLATSGALRFLAISVMTANVDSQIFAVLRPICHARRIAFRLI